ncbi:hypothetical protein Mp_3g06350 [Marchantia polymorpha subsp. ruderalis]|uniref:Uncharacterized protein n=2 Tax=Marchantia polymorpha TaxID=3197 RepID=A0AAF6AY02_MARPO|nr:hypothetical protein MARPO_0006s0104 [Marchantia polymorpha]BBN04636.1 hypothetical protein Mp_3g06350 [Marchantia polymorpha subsp. ruderalis]|eukprot:PTQ48072.1 hypothetical protein MARPO_0006s0104 [Marchantia polymorpha]
MDVRSGVYPSTIRFRSLLNQLVIYKVQLEAVSLVATNSSSALTHTPRMMENQLINHSCPFSIMILCSSPSKPSIKTSLTNCA